MKKKFLALVCAGLMALSFAACGDSTLVVDDPEPTEAPAGNNAIKPTGYAIKLNDVDLFIGQNMKAVYDKIGETAQISESGSCKYDGIDKEYKFAHVTVTAIIEGAVERVFAISFDDDLIATTEGVRIGDPASAISVKYGAPQSEGSYVYKKDGMYIQFTVKNDEVATILYTEE